VIPTPKMWEFYAQFTKDCFNRASSANDKKHYLELLLNQIYPQANNRSLISTQMLHDYVTILKSIGQDFNHVLQAACQKFNDFELWILNIELSEQKQKVIDKAIEMRTVPIHETDAAKEKYEQDRKKFWRIVLDHVEKIPSCNVGSYYLRAIKDCGNDFKIRYIEWSIVHGDVDKCVSTVLAFTPNNESVYRNILKYYGKDWDGNYDKLIKLYGKAISEHGPSCEDFWIGYIVLMKRRGELQRVHNLYYQAMKTLKITDRFVEKYDLIK
jgi:hypothetical protein